MTVMATIYSYLDSRWKHIYTLEGAIAVDLGIDGGSAGLFPIDEFKFLPDEITENVGGFDVPLEELEPTGDLARLLPKTLKAFDESQPRDNDYLREGS